MVTSPATYSVLTVTKNRKRKIAKCFSTHCSTFAQNGSEPQFLLSKWYYTDTATHTETWASEEGARGGLWPLPLDFHT